MRSIFLYIKYFVHHGTPEHSRQTVHDTADTAHYGEIPIVSDMGQAVFFVVEGDKTSEGHCTA